jgi:hypothetical protein
MSSLLIHLVLSHRLSCPVKSIVLLSSLFLYHHNFTKILFFRINSINTNLISLRIFTISLITISYFLFTLLDLLLECSTFSPQFSTITTYLSHQHILYLLYLFKTSSSFNLFIYKHMNDIDYLNIRTYLFMSFMKINSGLITSQFYLNSK